VVEKAGAPEQLQQKCAAVLRPELPKDKKMARLRDSEKSGSANRKCDINAGDQPDTSYGEMVGDERLELPTSSV
jgi:hypothetical protein